MILRQSVTTACISNNIMALYLAVLGCKSVKGFWCFKMLSIVSVEFLTHEHFKSHFVDGVTALMSHLFIMVALKDGEYT